MKLIIDIDEDTYKRIKGLVDADYFEHDINGFSQRAIANGTPIPDNASNGEIADLMFPDVNMGYRYWFPDSTLRFMDTDWWNAPYQKGGK